jgi:hypothetical protein
MAALIATGLKPLEQVCAGSLLNSDFANDHSLVSFCQIKFFHRLNRTCEYYLRVRIRVFEMAPVHIPSDSHE